MHKLDDEEIRILLNFALTKVSASTLQAMHRGPDADRRRARELAVQAIMAHLKLSRHDLYRPETKSGPLFG